MYKCDDCGAVFSEPDEIKECVGECWGRPAYETWMVCPECASTEIDECKEESEEEE